MNSTDRTEQPALRRRSFVTISLAAVGGAIVGAGATWGGLQLVPAQKPADEKSDSQPSEDDDEIKVHRFVSTALTLPVVKAWATDGAQLSPGYTFLSPRDSILTGAIIDSSGEPIWIAPNGVDTTDVRVQTYKGKPVLTFWEGRVASGNGHGTGRILDTSYTEIAAVHGGHGAIPDLHEFHLTDRDTALVTTYPVARLDLSSVGGPTDGYAFACRVQEIDIATGRVLVDWNILDDIALDESKKRIDDDDDTTGTSPEKAFDPIHVNSIDDDGDRLLISCRHTCALYAINRTTGALLWRLGGTKSDVEMGEGTEFSWQHDARWRENSRISLFNNAGVKGDGAVSSGLILRLDEEAMTAELDTTLTYGEYEGYAMGNTQLLEDGHAMVGWGSAPAVTEFDADGTAIAGFTEVGAGSYRAYRFPWTGEPTTIPDLATMSVDGTSTAFMSWNGATRVDSWALLAGSDASELSSVATAKRSGFETAIEIPDAKTAAFLQVEARDADGTALGRSRVVATR
ncbi:arylsulfotransferase family protein [Microbacterium sp. MPKO10]|uniref:arylsulfotransferase family protein n=1 Tax=Microbacterium sp. MPKO10 TaxID=2989818 RepID=UPI0022363D79|nr:arylsulfotransferase family protein [Microbacterium sp. MPKO10]MCW4459743.1 arylsulfotransferase family protein [Microbacterium sp. MPKO10]